MYIAVVTDLNAVVEMLSDAWRTRAAFVVAVIARSVHATTCPRSS